MRPLGFSAVLMIAFLLCASSGFGEGWILPTCENLYGYTLTRINQGVNTLSYPYDATNFNQTVLNDFLMTAEDGDRVIFHSDGTSRAIVAGYDDSDYKLHWFDSETFSTDITLPQIKLADRIDYIRRQGKFSILRIPGGISIKPMPATRIENDKDFFTYLQKSVANPTMTNHLGLAGKDGLDYKHSCDLPGCSRFDSPKFYVDLKDGHRAFAMMSEDGNHIMSPTIHARLFVRPEDVSGFSIIDDGAYPPADCMTLENLKHVATNITSATFTGKPAAEAKGKDSTPRSKPEQQNFFHRALKWYIMGTIILLALIGLERIVKFQHRVFNTIMYSQRMQRSVRMMKNRYAKDGLTTYRPTIDGLISSVESLDGIALFEKVCRATRNTILYATDARDPFILSYSWMKDSLTALADVPEGSCRLEEDETGKGYLYTREEAARITESLTSLAKALVRWSSVDFPLRHLHTRSLQQFIRSALATDGNTDLYDLCTSIFFTFSNKQKTYTYNGNFFRTLRAACDPIPVLKYDREIDRHIRGRVQEQITIVPDETTKTNTELAEAIKQLEHNVAKFGVKRIKQHHTYIQPTSLDKALAPLQAGFWSPEKVANIPDNDIKLFIPTWWRLLRSATPYAQASKMVLLEECLTDVTRFFNRLSKGTTLTEGENLDCEKAYADFKNQLIAVAMNMADREENGLNQKNDQGNSEYIDQSLREINATAHSNAKPVERIVNKEKKKMQEKYETIQKSIKDALERLRLKRKADAKDGEPEIGQPTLDEIRDEILEKDKAKYRKLTSRQVEPVLEYSLGRTIDEVKDIIKQAEMPELVSKRQKKPSKALLLKHANMKKHEDLFSPEILFQWVGFLKEDYIMSERPLHWNDTFRVVGTIENALDLIIAKFAVLKKAA